MIEVTVNGERCSADRDAASLLELVREAWGLTGTKNACEQGECGSCTVLLDDVPVNACLVPATQADGCAVTTVEGLAVDGRPSPLQRAFLEANAVQCGFCTPGMLVMLTALLRREPRPTEETVRRELSGNLCRCTGYQHIVDAALRVAHGTGSR